MRLVRNVRRLVPRQVWSRLLHWPLSLLFLYSGCVKIFWLPQFAQSVGDFGIVLDGLVKPVAFIICIVELGLAYVLWQQRSWAMLATAVLLVCFLGVLLYGVAIGLDIECGCFGSGYKLELKQQFGVDLLLLVWCVCTHWFLRRGSAEMGLAQNGPACFPGDSSNCEVPVPISPLPGSEKETIDE